MLRTRLSILLFLALLFRPSFAASKPELWIYVSQNLWVNENIPKVEALFRRASAAGYTHVLLTDSKFAKLDEMDSRYFKNVDRVKNLAKELNLEIVPALFDIGYSNDLLWHDPNLIEGLPVRNIPLVVHGGEARLQPSGNLLKGGDLDDLKSWSWHDPTVISSNGAALILNPKGENARLVQKVKVTPFRQYHLSVHIKTSAFRGTPEVKVIAADPSGRELNYNSLGVKPTEDWTIHYVTFNSLDHDEVNLYLGCWGGSSGSLWFDDARLEEVAFLNLIRRDGAPVSITGPDGKVLIEGKDYEKIVDPKMGNRLWKGSYDIWHEPPVLKVSAPDGTQLKASYYNAVTVNDDQAMICLSEPRTMELLRDQARRMHAAWGAKGYMMSHDEIRVLNWCDACQKRHLSAGALLADNVRQCANLLREVNPGGRIYVWSDMFDPNHNAHDNYYLVNGDLAGSWEGLDRDIIVVPWYFEKRKESLEWFAKRGNRQVIAGYYDHAPEQVSDWMKAGENIPGVLGVMYTTWAHKYNDLEKFAQIVFKGAHE
jgi:hypothetical protein